MVKASDLREKEIVNVNDGSRLGHIADIEVNLQEGRIDAIVIPGPGRILGFFGKNEDYIIRWENIVKIGVHVVLVELNPEWENHKENRAEKTY